MVKLREDAGISCRGVGAGAPLAARTRHSSRQARRHQDSASANILGASQHEGEAAASCTKQPCNNGMKDRKKRACGAQQTLPHTCRPSPASSAPRPTAARLPSAAKHMGAAASASSAPALMACAAHGAQAAPAASAPAPDAAGSPGAGARQRSIRSPPAPPARDCTTTAVPAAHPHSPGIAGRIAAAACRGAVTPCQIRVKPGGASAAPFWARAPDAGLCDATEQVVRSPSRECPGLRCRPPGWHARDGAHLRSPGQTAPAARGSPAAGPARPPPGTPAASWRRLAARAQRRALCGHRRVCRLPQHESGARRLSMAWCWCTWWLPSNCRDCLQCCLPAEPHLEHWPSTTCSLVRTEQGQQKHTPTLAIWTLTVHDVSS